VDQPGTFQYANVPRDRRQGHGKGLGKLGDHSRLVHEAGEERPAGLVTQGAKKQVELLLVGRNFVFGA